MAKTTWTDAEATQLLDEYTSSTNKGEVVERWAAQKGAPVTAVRNKIQNMRTASGSAKWSSYKNPYSVPALKAYQREYGIQKVLEAGRVMAEYVKYAEAVHAENVERLNAFERERDKLMQLGLLR
jgi:hypothetical protein